MVSDMCVKGTSGKVSLFLFQSAGFVGLGGAHSVTGLCCFNGMTSEELQELKNPQVQDYIAIHQNDDPAKFALCFHNRKDLPIRAIAEQIDCIQKAKKKLPCLSGHHLLYLPVALEQASGERAAAYKASVISGKRLIDLSGGLGIDAIFLSKVFETVIYCERDPLLAELVALNLQTLGITNIEVRTGDGLEILDTYPDDYFDWIYVDPARRDSSRRYVGLEACSPDVVSAQDKLISKAPRVCIKASPALDLHAVKGQLTALTRITVISVNRECKETLLVLERDRGSIHPFITKAACLTAREDGEKEVSIEASESDEFKRNVADAVGKYFYEPDPAIIKAKLTLKLASDRNLSFINATVDYLTSYERSEGFPGRVFEVVEVVPYKPKEFKVFLAQKEIQEASIQRRDFPLSPEELRKKFRLKESSEVFLFFTKDSMQRLVCVYCHR